MEKENYEKQVKKDFKDRFWELYKESGCSSVAQFAKVLGMNRQSVDRYYNGDRLPDLPSIYQICKKMNVSADWLLHISDVRKPSAELRGVSEFTGLSEESLNKIIWLSNYAEEKDSLSYLMELSNFEMMILKFSRYLQIVRMLKAEDLDITKLPIDIQNGKVVLGLNESVSFFKQEVKNAIDDLCDEAYTRHVAAIPDFKFPMEMKFESGKIITKQKEESADGKQT